MKLTLRPYQHRDVEHLRARFRAGDKSVLYVLPTGGGKTVVFCYITESAARRNNKVLVLVHRQELIRQTSTSLTEIGVPHGILAPGYSPDPFANVQIASVQTLVRRLGKIPTPQLIIIDETHHARAATWGKILTYYKEAHLLGVTATPVRLSGEGLGRHCGGHFDSMVNGPSLSELIKNKYLSPPVVYTPPVGADLSGLHKRYGEFNQAETSAAMDKQVITGCAVEHYRKICKGVPAIAFCASVKHAENVAAEFRAAGYQSASIDGTMHDNDRKGRLDALGNGRLNVLTSCDLVSEGFDLPVVGAAILLRPTASIGMLLQQVGRSLRVSPGKECAIILDHVGNLARHNLLGIGLPEYDLEWSLDGEIKRKKTSEGLLAIRQCPACYRCFRPAPACPFCGHVSESNAREIDQVDGELTQIDPATLARLREAESNRAKMFRQREEGMCKTLDDWKALADKRGYASGWAFIRFNQRKGRTRPDPPMLPGM